MSEWLLACSGAVQALLARPRNSGRLMRLFRRTANPCQTVGHAWQTCGTGSWHRRKRARPGGGTWVLVRVAADPEGRVLVYDEHEWECFLDGVRNGEFDLTE